MNENLFLGAAELALGGAGGNCVLLVGNVVGDLERQQVLTLARADARQLRRLNSPYTSRS